MSRLCNKGTFVSDYLKTEITETPYTILVSKYLILHEVIQLVSLNFLGVVEREGRTCDEEVEPKER